MTTFVLGCLAFLLLPLFGFAVWRLEDVRKLDLAGRIGIATAAGMVVVAAVLGLLSILRIDWSRTSVFICLTAIIIASWWTRARTETGGLKPAAPLVLVAFAAVAILLLYGLATARMSSGDVHFFYGPKAIRFFQDGGVTLTELQAPWHAYMNRDYPLLLPMLFAWLQTVAKNMSWQAAVLATALFYAAIIAIVRATSKDDTTSVVMAMSLTYATARAAAAGAAEPPLLLFEVLALCALTFFDDDRGRDVITAIALIGAASTKLEGTTFAIAVAIAIVLVQRDFRRAIRVCIPAAIVIGSWLAFVKLNGLSGGYGGATMPIFLEAIPRTLIEMAKAASYGLWGLPWLAAFALIFLGDIRRAALPLVVAALTLGVIVFFYIHVPDPTLWIAGSGPRVLLTPLACLYVAAAAAGSKPAVTDRSYSASYSRSRTDSSAA